MKDLFITICLTVGAYLLIDAVVNLITQDRTEQKYYFFAMGTIVLVATFIADVLSSHKIDKD